jgi:hypothetical protein
MYMLNYYILWKKITGVFQPNVNPDYEHEGLTNVIHKWVQAK